MKRLDPKLRRIVLTQQDQMVLRRDLETAVTTSAKITKHENVPLEDVVLDTAQVYKRCIVSHNWERIPEPFAHLDWNIIVGNIYSVAIPISLMNSIALDSGVEYVEAGKPFSPMLSTSLQETGITTVHTGAPGLEGVNVVIGIIDHGLDYRLDDFRNEDDSTRIAFIWDQGLSPSGQETFPNGFNYGVEYDQKDINHDLKNGNLVRHQFSKSSHATHVAGIAAGNGRTADASFKAEKYSGAAPKSTIIYVSPKISDQRTTLTDSTNVADAIAYIYRKADTLGLPCVINMSLGHNGGSHDGESTVERAIDRLLEVPGRAFISAAGNEQEWRGHTSGVMSVGETKRIRWKAGGFVPWLDSQDDNQRSLRPGEGDFTSNELEIWLSSRDEFRARVISPSGGKIPWAQAPHCQVTTLANGNQVFIDVERFTVLNGNARIYIEVKPLNAVVERGEWIVELDGISIIDGRYDGFIERDYRMFEVPSKGGSLPKYKVSDQSFFVGTDFDPVMTLGTPATSRRGIAVANYDHQSSSPLPHSSSSRGPTRDGRHKPEISAPGTNILSTNAKGGMQDNNGQIIPVRAAKTGTSMSAPHVSGLVALLFELNPKLTCAQIRNILIASAMPKVSSNGFDPAWGYGAVDAVKAVELVEKMAR